MANKTYLDEDGLSYLWGKISAALNLKANLKSPTLTGTPKAPTASAGTNTTQIATTAFVKTAVDNAGSASVGIIHYGLCDDAANVAAKTATVIDTTFKLEQGVTVIVAFNETNTATECTLNVNNTGAKDILYNNAIYVGSSPKVCGYEGRYIAYTYLNGVWTWMGASYDDNTTYSAMTQADATTGTATTGRLISAKLLNDVIDDRQATINSSNLKQTIDGSSIVVGSEKLFVNHERNGGMEAAVPISGIVTDRYNAITAKSSYPYTANVVDDIYNGIMPKYSSIKNNDGDTVGDLTQMQFMKNEPTASVAVFNAGYLTSSDAESYQKDSYPYSAAMVETLLATKADAGQALKSCVIGQPNTESTDNWFKVAELSLPAAAGDRDLIFLVSALYPVSSDDYGRKVGILKLHARTASTGFSPTSLQNNLIWLSNTGFDASDFAIAFDTDVLPATVQLWVKIEHRYQRYSFTLLKESSRTAMLTSTELFSGTTGAAAPTSGYTVVYSTNEYLTDHLFLGECDTAAATAAKVITVDDPRFALTKGVEIYVKFTNSNSASDVTLNVNGTGAYPIWYGASAYTGASTTVCGYAGRYLKYVFDGTYWVWAGHSTDLNTTYTNMSQTEANTGTATTARTISAKVLETKIENVLSSYFQYESATSTYSLAAGATYSGSVSSAVANSIFALAGFNSGNDNVVFTNIRKWDSDGDIHYTIRNVGTSAVSNATLYISFITKAS